MIWKISPDPSFPKRGGIHRKSGRTGFFTVRCTLYAVRWVLVFGLWSSVSHAQTVRVAVLQNIPKFSLTVNGPYQIFPVYSSELLWQGTALKEVPVTGTPAGIQMGDQELPVFGITLRSDNPQRNSITLNGRHFRGEIDIYRQKDQTLLVVNHLDVEDYLQGVLYHEVSHRWHIEVLKAQAIASRTYVLYQATVSANKDFDVTSDVFSQVYGGATSEKSRTNRAVMMTKGEILIWDSHIFPTYFHATCGGHTLASNELWKLEIPPLSGVRCPFCADSPHFYWKWIVSKESAVAKLKKAGYFIEDIDGIETSRSDSAGRVLDLLLLHPEGELEIPANAFRLAMGSNQLRSTFSLNIDIQDQKIVFRGKGWGHGVGMCQWGAYGMARKRKKVGEILAYYYPGAEIVRIQ